MSIRALRTVRDDDGHGRTQFDLSCDGPGCDVGLTTNPFGPGEELLSWPTLDLADEDCTRLWFCSEDCLARWTARNLSAGPSLVGYSRVILDRLVAAVHGRVSGYADYGEVAETRRGGTFEVRLVDADGPTGYVARVTVELDRVEQR